MPDIGPRIELPPAGGIAWLDVSADTADWRSGRARTGPLGLQIVPLPHSRAPYFFKGARMRGGRCIFSAGTVSGAELSRATYTASAAPPGPVPVSGATAADAIHVLVRVDSPGSVFDAATHPARGMLKVLDPGQEIREQFPGNTHLFTFNVPRATIGIEPAGLVEMLGHAYELTPFQLTLLRGGIGLLLGGSEELGSSASLVGVDRYLGAFAGLLLRTCARRPGSDQEQMESIRNRTDAIIFEQAVDPVLTPAGIAAQLNISLRQLYRAFNGTESPAARIRRRRLEHAAEMLAGRAGATQVERIAQECGFVSAEYFSRAFRREFGLSPRAYRSQHRERTIAKGTR